MEPIISNIRFIPMKRVNSFIGFVAFNLEIPTEKDPYKFSFKSMRVHELLDKTDIRLEYPEDKTIKNTCTECNGTGKGQSDICERCQGNGTYCRPYIYPINDKTQEFIREKISEFFYDNYIVGETGEVEGLNVNNRK